MNRTLTTIALVAVALQPSANADSGEDEYPEEVFAQLQELSKQFAISGCEAFLSGCNPELEPKIRCVLDKIGHLDLRLVECAGNGLLCIGFEMTGGGLSVNPEVVLRPGSLIAQTPQFGIAFKLQVPGGVTVPSLVPGIGYYYASTNGMCE